MQLLSNSPLESLTSRVWKWSVKNPIDAKEIKVVEDTKEIALSSQRFWVDDRSVSSCFECQRTFSILLLRRHHCRICGKIFCGWCAPHLRLIRLDVPVLLPPQQLGQSSFLSRDKQKDEPQRVCNVCNKMLDQLSSEDKSVLVFEKVRLIEFWLDVSDLVTLLQVSKAWRFMMKRKIEEWRSWFFCLSSLSPIESSVIWNWYPHLGNHPAWILLLCRNMPKGESHSDKLFKCIGAESKNKYFCRLICSESIGCADRFRLCHLVQFMKHNPYSEHVTSLIQKVDHCSTRELLACIPILTEFLGTNPNPFLINFLIKACSEYLVRISFYWWVCISQSCSIEAKTKSVYQQVLEQLYESLPDKDRKDLHLHVYFVNALSSITENCQGNSEEARKLITKHLEQFKSRVSLPHDPTLIFEGPVLDQCFVFETASHPLLLTFDSADPLAPYQRLIVKNDDVRKDAIVMSLISIFNGILKRETGTDFHLLTYLVLPISQKRGLVTAIPGARTLFDIKHNSRHPGLAQWLLNLNGSSVVDDLIDRFVKSCAASCVVSYLLGVGDRHLGNILVTPEGYMCHIDFGFLLGDEPKPFAPEIRLDQEMVDFMGKKYRDFQQHCALIYSVLRQHIGIVESMLGYLLDCGLLKLSRQEFERQLQTRFRPTLGNNDAMLQFNLCLDKGRTSMTLPISDLCHYYMSKRVWNLIPFCSNKSNPSDHLLSEPEQYQGKRSEPISIPPKL